MTSDKAVPRCKQPSKPGMLFVGLSRIRHYIDIMIEDDFPATSHIFKLRNQAGYRMRLRWEEKCERALVELYEPICETLLYSVRKDAGPGKNQTSLILFCYG